MKDMMTGGQLTQIYNIATQQSCGQNGIQFLIKSGYMADFFAGKWQEENRSDFRKLGRLAPEDFGINTNLRNLGLTITLPAQPECKTAECFTGDKVFVYRNADFDNWLPATLPATAEVAVNGYKFTKVTTEAEMMKVGKPFTNLTQIENLILRTEKGEETGLITNGCANLFFLKVDATVFTVFASRGSVGWSVCLLRFFARNEWSAESRFFSPAT